MSRGTERSRGTGPRATILARQRSRGTGPRATMKITSSLKNATPLRRARACPSPCLGLPNDRGGQAPALRLWRPSPFHRRARACPSPCCGLPNDRGGNPLGCACGIRGPPRYGKETVSGSIDCQVIISLPLADTAIVAIPLSTLDFNIVVGVISTERVLDNFITFKMLKRVDERRR